MQFNSSVPDNDDIPLDNFNPLWPSVKQYDDVNIGSGNGLLPDGTKPLPDPVLTTHQWLAAVMTCKKFQKKFSIYLFINTSVNITNLKSQSYLPGAKEFKKSIFADALHHITISIHAFMQHHRNVGASSS